MGGMGGNGRWSRIARLLWLSAGCLALANCSTSLSSRIDPKYGVAASPRVVAPGEPVPKGGGVYRLGKPYMVGGREYVPREDDNYRAVGMASWYGDDFHGRYTANGEIFDMNSLSAAHPTLPLPSYVRVTNLRNHRSIVVRVNDRGPYAGNRVIDVSVKTAKLLGFYGDGVTKVKVEYVGRAPLVGSDDRKLTATLRRGAPGASALVRVASNRPYAPDYSVVSPVRLPAEIPAPPNRPFWLGEGAREVPVQAEPAADIMELAVASRAPAVTRALLPDAAPSTSPVSAYAPVRYDAHAGFMSGRGLY